MTDQNQTPLFNYSYLEYFDLKINTKCNEWDKFLEEFLLLRFVYFRDSFQKENLDFFAYFTNLLEGSFLILKSDLINDCIYNIKSELLSLNMDSIKLQRILPEYLQIINLGRIIIVHLIKTLYSNEIKINSEIVQKFMRTDSELDLSEKPNVKNKIMSYNYIKSKMPKDSQRIGKLY